jgi:hypothetical protein
MSRLSLAFFATAAVFALGGMAWGVHMAMTKDFTMAPAHAHLNLLGWASLGVMGAFYGIAGDRANKRLGWLNYALSASAVVVMTPALALLLASGGKENLGVMIAPMLAIGGMLVFLIDVLLMLRAPRAASA